MVEVKIDMVQKELHNSHSYIHKYENFYSTLMINENKITV